MRLPDRESLGARPVPQSRASVASNPRVGAVAGAIAEVGEVFSKIGAEKFQKIDQFEYAAAKAQVAKADMELRRALENDQDYSTFEARYEEGMKAARTAATSRISNHALRPFFETDTSTDLERGKSAVASAANGKRVVAGRAQLETDMDSLRDVASAATDEATRENAIKTSSLYIKGAEFSGLIDPLEAAQAREGWAGGLATSWTRAAIDAEHYGEATATLAKYGHFIPAPQLDALVSQIARGQRDHEEFGVAVAGNNGTLNSRPAESAEPAFVIGKPSGLKAVGNIDIANRPTVQNSDGTVSTVRSISIGTDEGEVLIPTVSEDGRVMTDDEAIAQYEKTGRHLGIFDSAASATAYAKSLHEQQAAQVSGRPSARTTTTPASAPGVGNFTAILSLESNGKHTNRDGSVKVSSAGAVGIAQIMPATGPEAARLAGVAWDPVKFRNDSAYNQRLGKAYYDAQLRRFGDPSKAAAAYNAGPGAVTSAINKAKTTGHPENWLSYLPKETRTYVAGFRDKTGAGKAAASGEAGAPPRTLAERLASIDQWAAEEARAGRPRSIEQIERIKGHVIELTRRDDSVEARDQGEAADQAADVIARLGDDFTSPDQIPKPVWDAMSPQARLSATDRSSNNKRQRDAASQDLNNYTTATNTPGFTWNPYDKGHVDAAEAAVKARGGTVEAALQVFDQTGIIAPTGVAAIRGGLASADPQRFRAAVNVASNMLRRNANAFAGVTGGEDIAKQAVTFNHYVTDLGIDPDVAANRVRSENTPEARAKSPVTDAQVTQFRADLRKAGPVTVTSVFGSDAKFGNDQTRVEFGNTYVELVVDELRQGRDMGTAKAMAAQQLRRTWGPTRGGIVMRYPPELGYPPINGSHDYLYADAQATLRAETGDKPGPKTFRFVPVPGVTDEDFRTGKLPRYRIIYSYEQNGQKVYDAIPGLWAADVKAPKQAAQADARQKFDETRDAGLGARKRRQLQSEANFAPAGEDPRGGVE